MSDIIDINIYPVVETISLTIEPNLTTINVNTISGGGGAVDSVNGQTGVVVLDIPTNTSDLVNDGEDGVHPYITLLDLPSNLILYPTTVASDISGYVKLVTDIHDVDYNTTAVDVSTGVITTTNQLISSLITVPDLISGNPGVFNISTVGNIRRTSGSGTAEFYFNVYKRDSLGTETLIGVSNPTLPVNNGVYAEFSATAIWDDGVFTATDRIVLKFYGSRIAGGSSPTYEFQFGGLTPIRTLVPIPLSVVPITTTPTLQEVLDNNHDLLDGNNYQGDYAGDTNTGTSVNAFGTFSGNNNSGTNLNALGASAAQNNTGNEVNALGSGAALDNTGESVNAIGVECATRNSGYSVNAIGANCAFENSGNHLNAFGIGAGYQNTADNVNVFGYSFGVGFENTFKNVNLFGFNANADAENQTVFSKWVTNEIQHLARLSFNNITADRKYELPNASGTLALLSDIPSIPNATETVAGIAEIATTAEVETGTDDARIITPLKLKQVTDNYMEVVLNCNVLGTTVNGGTNIVMYQVDVPANTFSDLDAFEIEALSAKVGTTAASTIRLWTDTASIFNSGTAQLLALSPSLGTTNLYQTIKREFHVRGTTLKCLANNIQVATDEATNALTANPWASYTFNPAVANTLYFTVSGNAADTFTKQNYKITRYKNKSTI